jgi:hypothetical protein
MHLVEAVSNRFKGNAIPRCIAFLRSFTMIPSIHKELGKLFYVHRHDRNPKFIQHSLFNILNSSAAPHSPQHSLHPIIHDDSRNDVVDWKNLSLTPFI